MIALVDKVTIMVKHKESVLKALDTFKQDDYKWISKDEFEMLKDDFDNFEQLICDNYDFYHIDPSDVYDVKSYNKPCDKCNGYGLIDNGKPPYEDDSDDCNSCNGKGYIEKNDVL